MAIVIDIGKFLAGEKPAAVDTKGAEAPPPVGAPARTVKMTTDGFQACQHRSMAIDDKQRTVKCGTCDIWLDPVWCLRELFHYYERRIDDRVQMIAEWDKKQADAAKRRDARQRRPRFALIERRAQSMERAAYNEYQSKVLALRAERQRALAAKLDDEIAEGEQPPSADAVDPAEGIVTERPRAEKDLDPSSASPQGAPPQ